jgi:hypothetical protein
MPDSDAVRSRRKRQHAAGDHSICRHGRPFGLVPAVPVEPGPDFDPREEMRRLAGRLAAAYAADPSNAALARELRATLQAIVPEAEPEWDPIKELQLQAWESRKRERDEFGG